MSGNESGVSFVPGLHRSCGPSAVSRLVTFGVVNPIQCQTRRAFSHVQ